MILKSHFTGSYRPQFHSIPFSDEWWGDDYKKERRLTGIVTFSLEEA